MGACVNSKQIQSQSTKTQPQQKLRQLMHIENIPEGQIIKHNDIPQIIQKYYIQQDLIFLSRQTVGKRNLSFKQSQESKVDLELLTSLPVSLMQRCPNPNTDNRKVIKEKKYPHTTIGCLIASYQGTKKIQKYFGTASIIHKNYILTCAHNVYNRQKKQKAMSAIFIPILVGTCGAQFNILPQKIYYPKQYEDPQLSLEACFEYDYAVIEVEAANLSQSFGCLGLNTAVSENKNAFIYGYANNQIIQKIRKEKHIGKQKIENKKSKSKFQQSLIIENSQAQIEIQLVQTPLAVNQTQEKWQLGTSGKVQQYNQNPMFMTYQIPTNQGQSGSPILRQIGQNSFQIIGIHQRIIFYGNLTKNSGIKLSVCKNFINSIIKSANKQITIKGRSFDKKGFKQLTQSLFNWYWNKLTRLNLTQNKISSQMLSDLSSINKKYQKLICLNLSNNKINSLGIEKLCKPNVFPCLQKLILNDNQIKSQGVKCLVENHYCFPSLVLLFLSSNQLDKKAIEYLTIKQKQKYPFPFLDNLELGDNWKYEPTCKELGKLFKSFPNLTHLGMRRNFLTDQGLSYLGKNGKALSKVKQLGLGNNYITNICSFVQQVNGFVNLEILWLQYNTLNQASLNCLSESQYFPSLIELQLCSNNLNAQSIKILFKTQGCFPHLEIINLSLNHIGKQGCSILSQKHKAMPKLKQLNLIMNEIDDEGIAQLETKSINKVFTNLKVLKLGSNHIRSKGFKILIQNRALLKSLITIQLSNNFIDNQAMQHIANLQPIEEKMPNLKNLILKGNDLNDQNMNILKAAFPSLKFE